MSKTFLRPAAGSLNLDPISRIGVLSEGMKEGQEKEPLIDPPSLACNQAASEKNPGQTHTAKQTPSRSPLPLLL